MTAKQSTLPPTPTINLKGWDGKLCGICNQPLKDMSAYQVGGISGPEGKRVGFKICCYECAVKSTRKDKQ